MSEGHHHHQHPAQPAGDKVIDPVCGMTVDPATTAHRAEHHGQPFFFCSNGCRTKFEANPQNYLGPKVEAAPADPGATYTCPMHPEVLQLGPGACPICGMALDPLTVSAETGPNHELIDFTRRFWVGAVLTAPLFALEMTGHISGLRLPLGHQALGWVELLLSTPVVLWAGWPFFQRGWASIVTRKLNMFTLISMGVGVAWTYSVAAVLVPDRFPAAFRDSAGAPPVYFEAAAMIVVLVLLGQLLELRARERTSGAIRALLNLAPKTARRVRDDGTDEEIAIDLIQRGERLRVRPGDKVPVDGEILDGRATIDESLITGESMPATREPGDRVVAGALNKTGAFVMRVEAVGADTLLARIAQMVAEAQRSRAPIQRLADQVAAAFVPAVVGVAILAAGLWATLGPEPRLAYALLAAVSVLIVACPCALGLATPMSIMVGVGRGAQAGVLVKDAQALERLESIDTLVFDKTGTLTEGRPAVIEIRTAAGVVEADLLRLAASLERNSEHPLADAIQRAASERALSLLEPQDFDSPVGLGVVGSVDKRRIALGGARLMAREGVDIAPLALEAESLRQDGATVIFAAIDGGLAGVIAIADPIRTSAPAAIRALQAEGIRLVMLTGDNRTTALAVARRLGIDEVEAEALPQDKARVIERLRAEGHVVGMAGDGINDAPALAAADVGVAMGAGADVAIESAGLTLLKGDLEGLRRARRLSRAVMRNIRQNLAFAFVYNLAGVPIAAGLLYPAFGWLLSPQLAAAAMALSSVSVISNALRLRTLKL